MCALKASCQPPFLYLKISSVKQKSFVPSSNQTDSVYRQLLRTKYQRQGGRKLGPSRWLGVPSGGRCWPSVSVALEAWWFMVSAGSLGRFPQAPRDLMLNYLSESQQWYFAVMARLCAQAWVTPSHESECLGLMTHCVFCSDR